MKRLILTLAIAVISTITADAQYHDAYESYDSYQDITLNMKYKQLKNIYNYKMYTKDPLDRYSPGWCGFASFCIPGLGQAISGEVGRGFAWFGGYMVTYSLIGAGGIFVGSGNYYGSEELYNIGQTIAGVASLAELALIICSTVDAIRVAKVKNMYDRDIRRKYSFEMDVYPSVDCFQTCQGAKATAGMTLALRF